MNPKELVYAIKQNKEFYNYLDGVIENLITKKDALIPKDMDKLKNSMRKELINPVTSLLITKIKLVVAKDRNTFEKEVIESAKKHCNTPLEERLKTTLEELRKARKLKEEIPTSTMNKVYAMNSVLPLNAMQVAQNHKISLAQPYTKVLTQLAQLEKSLTDINTDHMIALSQVDSQLEPFTLKKQLSKGLQKKLDRIDLTEIELIISELKNNRSKFATNTTTELDAYLAKAKRAKGLANNLFDAKLKKANEATGDMMETITYTIRRELEAKKTTQI